MGQIGAELELQAPILLCSVIYIDTFIMLNGITLYFCTSLSKERSYCQNPYVLTYLSRMGIRILALYMNNSLQAAT